MDLGARVHTELLGRRECVASAESLTGGALAEALTATPGASETYVGGVVSYATAVKVRLLGVPQEVVDAHGVVSAECARAMAEGVRSLLATDWAVSTTGVAGPDEQEGKPVGTVYVGVASTAGSSAHALDLDGGRAEIRAATVRTALTLLLGAVTSGEGTG